MILARIAQAIKRQDWFQVNIEILIVVIGIFLGLQVSEWNERRLERIHEQFILQQLQDDFIESKSLIETAVNKKKDLIDDLYFAVKIMQSGKLEEEDRDRFELAYYRNNSLQGTEVVMGTYNSLVAAGEFNIIQDEILRKMLLKFDARIVKEKSFLDYVRNYFLSTSEELNNLLIFRADKNNGEKIIEVDFEGLMNNREARAFLTERYGDHWQITELRKEILVQVNDIIQRIEEISQKD